MEKVKYYQAVVEKERKPFSWEDENREFHLISIGSFKDEKDAEGACKLYIVASRYKENRDHAISDCTGNYMVKELSCPKKFIQRPDYTSLDEFIESHVSVKLYSSQIGADAMEKLLKEMGVESKKEKNLRII